MDYKIYFLSGVSIFRKQDKYKIVSFCNLHIQLKEKTIGVFLVLHGINAPRMGKYNEF